MGTRARLWTWGGPTDLERRLRTRLAELECRWSRFAPDSEVSRANEAAGHPLEVSAETVDLVGKAVLASQLTRGWFDPLLLPALEAAGYDRPFAELVEMTEAAPPLVASVSAPTGSIVVHEWTSPARFLRADPSTGTITVPSGAAFDPGGIGKGLAADLLLAQALVAGAASVLVDLGGDLVCGGAAPEGGWAVAVDDPFDPDGAPLTELSLPWGAVATSSKARRRWRRHGIVAHHLLDPRSGTPSTSDVVAATVVAGDCWAAEVHAKTAVVAGVEAGLEILVDNGVEGLLVDTAGGRHLTPAMAAFLR